MCHKSRDFFEKKKSKTVFCYVFFTHDMNVTIDVTQKLVLPFFFKQVIAKTKKLQVTRSVFPKLCVEGRIRCVAKNSIFFLSKNI